MSLLTNLRHWLAGSAPPPVTHHRNAVLDGELLRLSLCLADVVRGRDMVQSTIAFGITGSGKSAAVQRAYFMALAEAGYGGIVTTFKAEDPRQYLAWCEQAGRQDDVILFSAGGEHRLNVLQHLYASTPDGFGPGEVLGCLLDITSAHARQQNGDANSDYWLNAMSELLRIVITLADLGRGDVSLPTLHRIITSLPTSIQEYASDDWRKDSFCYETMELTRTATLDDEALEDLAHAIEFVAKVWPNRAPENRASILSVYSGIADPLLQRPFRRLFSTDTTITPEETFSAGNKIIILDFPLDMYGGTAARDAQLLWLYAWQRAIRRRSDRDDPEFPISFCIIDEFSMFCTDEMWKTTSVIRSSRGALMLLTQSRESLLSALGGAHAASKVDALLANCATKIFLAADNTTASYAAETVGRTMQLRRNINVGRSRPNRWDSYPQDGSVNKSGGLTETVDHQLLPIEFTMLPIGTAIVHQTGRIWEATGMNWLPVKFSMEGNR